MNDFLFQIPTRLYFGKGEEPMVGKRIREYGGSRVLLHYGGRSIQKTGLYDNVLRYLKDAGLTVCELGGVQPNPRLSLCRKGIEICRREGVDFILAVGGGSVIDSAKCISLGVFCDGDVWDYYTGAKKEPERVLPICSILTIPAAGSEGNSGSVITNEDGNFKLGYGHPSLYPVFSILNPETTFTLPPYQTAAGAVDTIAHTLSAYITDDTESFFVQSIGESVIRTVVRYAPKALENPTDYNARAQLMWAATMAANGSISTGCLSDGTSHIVEHELSALYDITHGAGLAIVIPGWFKYIYKKRPETFARFANRIFGIEIDPYDLEGTALKGIAALERFFQSLGMPVRLSEADIGEDRFEEIAERCYARFGKYGQIQKFGKRDTVNILNLCK